MDVKGTPQDSGRYQDRKLLPMLLDRLLAPWVDLRETIVVSGFWRSGTTWLQESLAALVRAKTVFEPFHWRVPAYIDAVVASGYLPRRDTAYLKAYMPYLDDLQSAPELSRFIAETMRANIGGGSWVRRVRNGASESLRSQVVVKLVRGHLCLHAINKEIGMPIVHIYRDPRAIIASMQRNNWWWLKDLSLEEQLLEPTDGRAAFFGQWHDLIVHYDNQDIVARVAAYWALTELFVRQHKVTDEFRFVGYEALCRDTKNALSDLLRRMGITISFDDTPALRTDSGTTLDERVGISVQRRVKGWKDSLDQADINTVESVAKAFEVKIRTVESMEGGGCNG